MMNKAQEVARWLKELRHGIFDVKPVRVTIGDETWQGAYYKETSEYTRDMMAVTHGNKKAGDTYTQEKIYLVGDLPTSYRAGRKNNLCFSFENRDWYIASYFTAAHVTPDVAPYHPFGTNFLITPWNIPNEAIDKYERKPYTRIPLTMEFEEPMLFRVLDGNDSNVLGGDVSSHNYALLGIEELIQTGCDNLKITHITELNVNESVYARFRTCGTTGTYKVLRVK